VRKRSVSCHIIDVLDNSDEMKEIRGKTRTGRPKKKVDK